MTHPPMPERGFVILRYEGKIPAMAGCVECERKFFTPTAHAHDPLGAEQYLLEKFEDHECKKAAKSRRREPWK